MTTKKKKSGKGSASLYQSSPSEMENQAHASAAEKLRAYNTMESIPAGYFIQMGGGIIFFFIGAIASALSHQKASEQGGTAYIYHGLIIVSLIAFIKGLVGLIRSITENDLPENMKQAPQTDEDHNNIAKTMTLLKTIGILWIAFAICLPVSVGMTEFTYPETRIMYYILAITGCIILISIGASLFKKKVNTAFIGLAISYLGMFGGVYFAISSRHLTPLILAAAVIPICIFSHRLLNLWRKVSILKLSPAPTTSNELA